MKSHLSPKHINFTYLFYHKAQYCRVPPPGCLQYNTRLRLTEEDWYKFSCAALFALHALQSPKSLQPPSTTQEKIALTNVEQRSILSSEQTKGDMIYLTNKEASTVLCSVVKHEGSGRALKKWGKTLDYVSCFPLHFFRALPLPACFTTEQNTVEASLFVL